MLCFRDIFLTLKNFCNSLLVDFTVTKLRFPDESARQYESQMEAL